MKLMTKELWRKMPKIGATDGKPDDEIDVIAKFSTPDGAATWYITEGDPATGRLFGLCDLGLGFPELGYVDLRELETVRGRFGLKVERDLWFEGTLADAWKWVRR